VVFSIRVKEHHSEYCCPVCLLDKRKKDPSTPPPKPPCAVDLPRTKLSEWLELNVSKQIQSKKRQLAKEKATAEVRWLTALFE
jgi:E1A/CREB-binding protein